MNQDLRCSAAGYEECAEGLVDFRNRNREIPRDRRYFDWRYLGRPCSEKPIIVWAHLAGERVGALTVFPHDFHVLDGECPIGILGDISVDTRHRGVGIAGAMFAFLGSTEVFSSLHGYLVLPNEGAARSFEKAGWRNLDRIERVAKVLDMRPRLARFVPPGVATLVAAPLNRLAGLLSYEALYRTSRYWGSLTERIDDRFDELWARADKHGKTLGLRNARYLRWRYETHPLVTYRKFVLLEGESLCGYAIYHMVGDACFVDDVFCIDPARHPVHVVGLLLAHLRDGGAVSSISISINRGILDVPWRRFGFMRRKDFQRAMIAPGKDTQVRWGEGLPKSWLLTAGDKDV